MKDLTLASSLCLNIMDLARYVTVSLKFGEFFLGVCWLSC